MEPMIFLKENDAVYFLCAANNELITKANKLAEINSPFFTPKNAKNTLIVCTANKYYMNLLKQVNFKFDDSNYGEKVNVEYIYNHYLPALTKVGIEKNFIDTDNVPLEEEYGLLIGSGRRLFFIGSDGYVVEYDTSFGFGDGQVAFAALSNLKNVRNPDYRLLLALRANTVFDTITMTYPIFINDTKTMKRRVYFEKDVLEIEEKFKKGELF